MDTENLSQLHKYKEIIQLYEYRIYIEKINYKPVTFRIYLKDSVEISLSAIYFHSKNPENYKKIKSRIRIKNCEINNLSSKDIQKLLITDIYKQVIKNEIIML